MARQLRILQVVSGMGRGGIETWLMHVLRHIDRERFGFDFMVFNAQPHAYDDEIRALGGRILPCTHPARAVAHLHDMDRIIRHEGPYDAIHMHGSAAAGAGLRLAARAGVPVRVIHAHNVVRKARRRLRSYVYRIVTQHWMWKHMTCGFGCSAMACEAVFGRGWRSDPRCSILHYGMNWASFQAQVDTRALRASLGITHDALVVGHVGRFVAQKNHDLWVEVAAAIAAERADVYFLLVGDGERRAMIEARVQQLGLADRFRFTGERGDIHAILQAMDVFLFPSLYEGLGLALVEAQAVGLPCVVSEYVPEEATVRAEQVMRLPLGAHPATWAQAVLHGSTQNRRAQHAAAWQAVADSRFSLNYCLDRLTACYTGQPVAHREASWQPL